jgi:hypothetical protein
MTEENEIIDYNKMAEKMTRDDKDNKYTFIGVTEENNLIIPQFKVEMKTKNG